MKRLLPLLLILTAFMMPSFKKEQMQNEHVKESYELKGDIIKEMLKEKGISAKKLNLYFRAFKDDERLEVWAKNIKDEKYQLLNTYPICRTSGELGPKREEGDRQVPEGFYFIERFNPDSSYSLSLKINYPNKSDKKLGNRVNPGKDIFIHGGCMTSGSLPMTDDKMKEIYILCVEAKNAGQYKIPIHIFPKLFDETNFRRLLSQHEKDKDKVILWQELQKSQTQFDETKVVPAIEFLSNGRHKIISN